MKCAILTCPVDGSHKCCRGCEAFEDCEYACSNDPGKCGQVVKHRTPKGRPKKRREITVFALEEKDKWRHEWDKSWNA